MVSEFSSSSSLIFLVMEVCDFILFKFVAGSPELSLRSLKLDFFSHGGRNHAISSSSSSFQEIHSFLVLGFRIVRMFIWCKGTAICGVEQGM